MKRKKQNTNFVVCLTISVILMSSFPHTGKGDKLKDSRCCKAKETWNNLQGVKKDH
jgi:hypothetical protein